MASSSSTSTSSLLLSDSEEEEGVTSPASPPTPPCDEQKVERSSSTTIESPEVTQERTPTNFLDLSDDLLLTIFEFFEPEQPTSRKPIDLSNLRKTCRHLSTLLRPLFWKTVEVATSEDAALVLRSWILFPETRSMSKILNCSADEVFARAVTALDLGLTHLRLSSTEGTEDAVLGRYWTDGLVSDGDTPLMKQLEEFCLIDFVGGFEDDDFAFNSNWESLKDLQIANALEKPERYYGLPNLENLSVLMTDDYVQDEEEDDDEDDDEDESEDESDEPTPLKQKMRVIERYLPYLEGMCLHGGSEGRYRYLSRKVGKSFFTLSSNMDSPHLFAPKLAGFGISNLRLFRPPSSTISSPLLPLLTSLQHCTSLRTLALRGFGTFHPPPKYESDWKAVRFDKVTDLTLESWTEERHPESFKGLLNEKTLRPLVHFVRMFPALRFLTIIDAFPDPSSTTLEASLVSAEDEERSLLHTALCTFLAVLLKESEVVEVRVGMLECYRRDRTVKEWSWDLIHDLGI